MPEKIASQETSQEQLKEREATKMEVKWYFVVGGDPNEIIIHPNGKRYKKKLIGYTEKELFCYDPAVGDIPPGRDLYGPYIRDLNKLTDRKVVFMRGDAEEEKVFLDEPIYRLVPESEEIPQEREATPMEKEWHLIVGGDPGEIIVIDGKKYKKVPDGGYTEKEAFSHDPGHRWDSLVRYAFDSERLMGRRINTLKTERVGDFYQIADLSDELLYRLIPIKEETKEQQ